MIARRLVLVAAMALASLSAPATAQLAPGISGSSSAPQTASEKEYWYLVRSMGDCLATNKTEDAEAFLASSIGSRAEGAAFKKLFGRSRNMCLGNFVNASFQRAHVRGSVAEGLYRREESNLPDTWRPTVEKPAAIGSIHDFAKCYVADNFAETRAFLRETKLTTGEETQYIERMAPSFAACLPNRKVTLKAINVRMALAEAMYHAVKSRQGRELAL